MMNRCLTNIVAGSQRTRVHYHLVHSSLDFKNRSIAMVALWKVNVVVEDHNNVLVTTKL